MRHVKLRDAYGTESKRTGEFGAYGTESKGTGEFGARPLHAILCFSSAVFISWVDNRTVTWSFAIFRSIASRACRSLLSVALSRRGARSSWQIRGGGIV